MPSGLFVASALDRELSGLKSETFRAVSVTSDFFFRLELMDGKRESTARSCISSSEPEICNVTKHDAVQENATCAHDEVLPDDLEANCSKQDWVKEEEAKKPLLSSSDIPELQNERLASLDVYRGLTVGAMILVDYAGGLWWGINHSPWHGVTFADFVVPAFIFIVGVSLTLSHKKFRDRRIAAYKIMLRVLKLFGLGLVLQGGYLHRVNDLSYGVDLQLLRIMGILQRITLAYAVVAILEVCSSKDHITDNDESFFGIVKIYRWQWLAAFVLTSLYGGFLYGLYVPDWQFEAPADPDYTYTNTSSSANLSLLLVPCNLRGSLSPGCNAVGFVDRSVLGITHLYKQPAYQRSKACSVDSPYTGPLPDNAPTWCLAPFDPEGLLSSLMAIVTCLIGAHYGHILLHVKAQRTQLWHWVISGTVILLVGVLLEVAGMPLNKQLYTLSFTCVTGGAVALCFIAIFVIVDVYKWRSTTAPFKWVGAHSLMIFALFACNIFPLALQGLYWKDPDHNLIACILTKLGF